MLIVIPQIVPQDHALALGREIAAADWVDGNETSGAGAARAKRNRQLPEAGRAAARARAIVQRALADAPIFLSAALPKSVYPPLFNRYGVGDSFGAHVDNAIRVDPATGVQMRTDISATLFLTDPDDYEGGALTVEGDFGQVAYRLPAGDLLLYPSTSLHQVTDITRGERISCFFWVQSLVRDGGCRENLFDLDQSIQQLTMDLGAQDAQVLRLTKVYHNLVRRWAA